MNSNRDDSNQLRRTLREVVALSTLPAIWASYDESGIAQSLASVLLDSLAIDFIYVRIAPSGVRQPPIELIRDRECTTTPEESRRAAAALARLLALERADVPSSIPHPLGEGTLHVVAVRFGLGDDGSGMIAGARQPGFPDESERTLLGVGANQAALVLQQKRAEFALRESEDRFRGLVTALPAAVYTTDSEGHITYYNDEASKLWNRPPRLGVDKWCGSKRVSATDGTEMPPEEWPITIALREGRSVRGQEVILEMQDGSRHSVLPHPEPLRDAQGRIIGAVNVLVDITERRQVEETLRRRERELTDFFDNATVGFHWVGPDGVILRANKAELAMLGYSHDEYVGRNIAEFHANQDTISEILRRLSAGEILHDQEATLRCKDGSLRHVLVDSSVLWQDGKFVHTRCFTRDITERKRAEQTSQFLADASATLAELTDYESTLQRIATMAVPHFADWCAVDIVTPEGMPRRLAVTHVDPTKVSLVRQLDQRYPPRPEDPRGVMRVLRTGKPDWESEIPDDLLAQSARDGEHLRVLREMGLKSYICVPLSSRGSTIGTLTFATADSGRIYHEDDLHAAEDLAHRSAIAIDNSKLLAALREADKRKDEFLAILAHELRNPLAPIRNAVQLLHNKGPAIPELQWARGVIDRQVRQMTRLVDDLLDVSRITRGTIELRREPLDLEAVIQSAVEASRPVIEEWGHELSVSTPAQPVPLHADFTRLSQVLLNLLNNAAKYTERGGRLALNARQEGQFVEIHVSDTGIGIPAEMLPRIFDMFTQADPSKHRSQGGLGIGLTLAARVVEMHGGTLRAHSEGPGKGSRFTVRLPIAAGLPPAAPADAAPDESKPSTAPRRRILVVDDNRDAANSLTMLLRRMNNEVHTAHDGLEAVRVAAEFRPDVVLMDIGLPKLNGYEAGRKIRADRGSTVILIAVTGWGQDIDRRHSKEAGFDHHFTKPLELSALNQLLATYGVGG